VNTCNGCLLLPDSDGFTKMLHTILGRSRRVAMVAERVVDASDDALYRNGLMAYVHQLKKGNNKTKINALKNEGF